LTLNEYLAAVADDPSFHPVFGCSIGLTRNQIEAKIILTNILAKMSLQTGG
jgi:hypothetical protein